MKNVTAMIITLAMLCAVSCTGNNAEPAETGNTTAATTGTSEAVSPTETTVETAVMTTVDTEEETETVATEPEPAVPKFDLNSEECLMYRLLDMTYAEIEAEFGEMTFRGLVGGGTPCYEIPEIGIQLLYHWETQDLENPVLKDQCPRWVETIGYEGVVYPGIYVGMDSKEFTDLINVDHVNFSMADFFPGFSSSYSFDGHSIIVLWNVPDELAIKVEEAILWRDGAEEDAARAELLAAIKSGNADITVGRITIS